MVKRCPRCGTTYAQDDRFCETDGATLVEASVVASPASDAGVPCPLCGQGTLEADGYCSSCGCRAPSLVTGSSSGARATASPVGDTRATPALIPIGARTAAGVVVGSNGADEYVVRASSGATVRVVVGDAEAIEHEADLLGRVGGAGAFPRLLERGLDRLAGPYLALAPLPAGAVPVAEEGARLTLPAAVAFVHGVVDVAHAVEKLGFAWEPEREDAYVGADGALKLSRVRVPRKLGPGERLDARAVVEAIGSAFVPTPAIEGPSRAFRVLMPHVPLPGDAGSSIDEIRAELASVERELGPLPDDGQLIAGLCHPGLKRPHNEDALAFATGMTGGERWSVLVVCDGVSSSTHAEQASSVAAKTACDALAHFARVGDVAHEAGAAAVAHAIRTAHVAVCAQGVEVGGGDPPGTTIVVGLVYRHRLTVGWVGDSRAYWVSEQGAELLTQDHSWLSEVVASGEVTEAEAMQSPLAHALTRCLGPLEVAGGEDGNGGGRILEVTPDVRARDLPGPGWVVLCTDGFWNYFPTAAQVSQLVRRAASGTARATPARIARRLVNLALARGGQDNTTALVYEHR
jgi:serine/threonine protein phosphatase PrpC